MTGTIYAAKRLKKTYKSLSKMMTCAEIVASSKIPWHPNVLSMIEYHYEPFVGKAIFIFELMDLSMYDVIKTKTKCLPETKVKKYFYQTLKGLEHLHRHGLFHRDVKPENILVKFSAINGPLGPDLIKLADLGSVRGTFSIPPYTEYISTRWYRSPECLLTIGQYGPKMDVWAAGCVFYEMLTLKPLFPGNNELDQLHRIHCILGTPNHNILRKFKTKSRNCVAFPEIKIKGKNAIQKLEISVQGKYVLSQMLQYDPDKRINIGRLLNNIYFEDLRQPFVELRAINRSMGDTWLTPNNRQKAVHKPMVRRESFADGKRENFPDGYRRSGNSLKTNSSNKERKKPASIPSSKTQIDIKDYIRANGAVNHRLRDPDRPFISKKFFHRSSNEIKSSENNKAKPEVSKFFKYNVQKKPKSDSFRKTTSDLPQIGKLSFAKNQKVKEFHSKSFVTSWPKYNTNSTNSTKSNHTTTETLKRLSDNKRKVFKPI